MAQNLHKNNNFLQKFGIKNNNLKYYAKNALVLSGAFFCAIYVI